MKNNVFKISDGTQEYYLHNTYFNQNESFDKLCYSLMEKIVHQLLKSTTWIGSPEIINELYLLLINNYNFKTIKMISFDIKGQSIINNEDNIDLQDLISKENINKIIEHNKKIADHMSYIL